MQIVTNEKLAKTRFRLGTAFNLIGLLILGVGLFVSLQAPAAEGDPLRLLAPYAAILVFLIPNYFGKRYLQRYGPKARHDGALAQAGKGLDNRYTLLSFPSKDLPDYLLVGPSGVHVLIPRGQGGTLACKGDRWEREGASVLGQLLTNMWGRPLGNPSRDLQDGIAKVSAALARRLDGSVDVPVDGVIVFTDPKVELKLQDCGARVTSAKNLKNAVRGLKSVLPTPQVALIRSALAPEKLK